MTRTDAIIDLQKEEKVINSICRRAKRETEKMIEKTLGYWPLLQKESNKFVYNFSSSEDLHKAVKVASLTLNTGVYLNREKNRMIILF